ncbi:MAG: hypothetical protein MRZ39_08435 [Oscillospiraceae bacterium]|nr:hypothetical protein [Oscillospiraceae bacterium]
MDDLYSTVEKLLFSEMTIGEVFEKMSNLGYSRDEIFDAIHEFDRKHIKTNSTVFD